MTSTNFRFKPSSTSISASANLRGVTLPNGWKVKQHFPRTSTATGGVFSHSYLAERDGRQGFVKAFDFSQAFEPDEDTLPLILSMTSAYKHEKEVLEICKNSRLSKVVVAIDHGEVQVDGYGKMEGRVYYLVFEMADGDIRGQVDATKRFDTRWSLLALKDVCLGLWQVHKQMIAHQDMKPSNVLIYRKEGFRIADFGRASRKGIEIEHNEFKVAGDVSYSPPELLYGSVHQDFGIRRFGCDLYMLGNLAAFMFGGVNVTGSLLTYLDPQFHWSTWGGSYEDVLPYVQQSFGNVLDALRANIDPTVADEIVELVSQLCNPDVAKRGHPRGLGRYDQYSLERYVTHFALLTKKLEVRGTLKAI